MSLLEKFGFGSQHGLQTTSYDLPEVFPMNLIRADFVRSDIVSIYTKILTDVAERTIGINEFQGALWDNFLLSSTSKGLVSMLAEAMADKKDLCLVYDKPFKMLRLPTREERIEIEEDYKKQAQSKKGILISFKNYSRTDMLRVYSALEYCSIGAFNKSVNTSNALQFKMKDLRGSTNLRDSEPVIQQAQAIAAALNQGKSVLLDSGDIIETASPDIGPTEKSINFTNQKKAFYLGLPEAYILGKQTGGIGGTGEGDTKAIERGLKNYFLSVFKPIVDELFGLQVSYKTQDFRQIAQGFEALKTFELIEAEGIIDHEEKRAIVRSLFDLESDMEK